MVGIVDDSAPDLKIDSAMALEPVTPHATDMLPAVARGLWSGAAGTLNFVDGTGTLRENFPVFPGPNMIVVRAVRPGGTADASLWAIY